MHVHVSALNAMITFAYFILFMFLVKTFSARYPDNTVSKGMRFLTS